MRISATFKTKGNEQDCELEFKRAKEGWVFRIFSIEKEELLKVYLDDDQGDALLQTVRHGATSEIQGLRQLSIGKKSCLIIPSLAAESILLKITTEQGVELSRLSFERAEALRDAQKLVRKSRSAFLPVLFLVGVGVIGVGVWVHQSGKAAEPIPNIVRAATTPSPTPMQVPTPTPTASPSTTPREIEDVYRVVLSYLSSSDYGETVLRPTILGDWHLLRWYTDTGEMYFSHPSPNPSMDSLGRFLADEQQVDYAHRVGDTFVIDEFRIQNPSHRTYIKTHETNFQPDRKMPIVVGFTSVATPYVISLEQLAPYLNNSVIYGGRRSIHRPGRDALVSNHGALVAKPGEPTITEFVNALTIGGWDREANIQRLLDFVNRQIVYNDEEAFASIEKLRRPNEVLLAKTSDCSGKAILFASFLEQLGEDYLLVYFPSHIAVFISQGNFINENGYGLYFRGQPYLLCEASMAHGERFEIGRTELGDYSQLTATLIQVPSASHTFEPSGKEFELVR